MSEPVTLQVGSREYRGWTAISIHRTLEAAAGSFSISLTEKWGHRTEPWPIMPGDECEVRLGDDRAVLGYVDAAAPSFDANRHELKVDGRDRTGDLVDCSAVQDPGEWKDVPLDTLTAELAEPFGVPVTAAVEVGEPFRAFKLQPGETAWEAIERACRQRGLLATSDAAGGLVLTRRSTSRAGTKLVQGGNIKSAEASLSHEDRFSQYIVKGTQPGTDHISGASAAAVSGSATDAGIARYRPLVVMAETAVNQGAAQQRAEWEATVRAGRSATASITVQGWRQSGGALWAPNLLVTVRSPMLRVDGDMLITGVRYELDQRSGATATLDLARPDAFEPKPEVESDEGAPWGPSKNYSTSWG